MKRLLFAALALLLPLPLAAAAEPFGKPVQKMCAQLRAEGWTAQADPLTNKPLHAEINVPGVLYLCTLAHVLPKSGPGHAPDLQVLLGDDGKERTIIFSADIWCEKDRAATADALALQLERILGPLPQPVSAAIRAWKEAKVTANGLTFEVVPVEVEPGACEGVPANHLGPVLVKVDVKVTPAT
jgi:hypothetical protein